MLEIIAIVFVVVVYAVYKTVHAWLEAKQAMDEIYKDREGI